MVKTIAGRCARALSVGIIMVVATSAAAGAGAGSPDGASGGGATVRVSVSTYGEQGNRLSGIFLAISSGGRYVAFASRASTLVVGDTNNHQDIFVRDLVGGLTERVSVGVGGQQANRSSFDVAVSAGARYVVFTSLASNLVAGDTNNYVDVFVRDRVAGQTERVSVGPGGREANSASYEAAISGDGRFVVFSSYASNLVPGDTNGRSDVFVMDRLTGVTTRVSVGPRGRQGNFDSYEGAVSAHGRYVAFSSDASTLVAEDTNDTSDVFVRDRTRHVTRRVSVGPHDHQGNRGSYGQAISANGRYVAFNSLAKNLVPGDTNRVPDVFVRDRARHVTRRVSVGPHDQQANNAIDEPVISADGRYVAFETNASNLVPGDTNDTYDIFLRDLARHVTERVSVGQHGRQTNAASGSPAISAHGRYVAFRSAASDLVTGDTNRRNDVFLRQHDPTARRRKE